jgi:hypothetical protein
MLTFYMRLCETCVSLSPLPAQTLPNAPFCDGRHF